MNGGDRTVVVRRYDDADLEAVTAIWLDSWRSTGISSPVTLEDLRQRWPNELARGWIVSVVVGRAEILGFLAIHEDRVEQLFIAPNHQSQGIGKRLLDHAKQQMPDGFRLSTALDSRAGKFYEREGLTPGIKAYHPKFGHQTIEYHWRQMAP